MLWWITQDYPFRQPAIAITGASSGIGYELARYFGEHGVRVYACARRPIPALPGVESIALDLRNVDAADAWAQIIDATDGLQMLVNNAGVVGVRAPFSDIPPEVWSDTVQTNIMATVAVTRAMLPLLRRGAPATIVNVGSVMGRFGRAGWTPYVTTKFALEGFTQALAQELFRSAIRVVTLHPARINTNLRRAVHGEEELFSSDHMAAVLHSVHWMLDNPHEPLSGLTLSSDDFGTWSEEP